MLRIIIFLILVVCGSAPVAAAEWRGIVPGRSTRQDVVREFAHCSDSTQTCEFSLAHEDVYITFSGPDTCENKAPADTVLLIERELVNPATLNSLNLVRERFKKFDPTWPRRIGYQGYVDGKAGLVAKAFNNRVFQIHYFPRLTDQKLCPNYYRDPRKLVETYVEHAPLVYLRCPENKVIAGDVVRFKAEYNRGLSILLTWNVSAGRIVEGQGRRRVALDTAGLGGQTIIVSIERADSTAFVSYDSCKVIVSQAIGNT